MNFFNFSNTTQKFGVVLSDVKKVESGTSQKTGRPYDGFAYFLFLPYGSAQVQQITIAKDFVEEVSATLEELDYLSGVVVTGEETSTGRFSATMVEYWDYSQIK